MNTIKNSKTLKKTLLVIMGIVAIVIIIWSSRLKSATPQPNYSKSIETSSTQPEAGIVTTNNDQNYEAPVEGDILFSLALEEIYSKYPWVRKLPIETDEYRILWELDNNRFRIRLKISSNSPQNVKDMVLSKALNNLRELIQDDLSNHEYYFLYND